MKRAMLILSYFHINAVSVDCQNVINLAFGLHLDTKQVTIWNQLKLDCCAAPSVTCVSLRVTEIDWNTKTLDGTINATAIPSTLTKLILFDNRISGNFPAFLPDGLLNLDLRTNFITGTISKFPVSIEAIGLHDNLMHGNIPPIPSTIVSIGLGWPGISGNHFSGKVVLNRPYIVYLSDNWITDIVILDTSQLGNSGNCDISTNPLLGNPNIAGLTMCDKTGIYSANSMPNTLSSSKLYSTTNIYKITSRYISFISSIQSASIFLSISNTKFEISTSISSSNFVTPTLASVVITSTRTALNNPTSIVAILVTSESIFKYSLNGFHLLT